MQQFIVELSDAEVKALSHYVLSVQEWINNIVHERCRIAIDEIVNTEIQRKLINGEPIVGTKEDIVLAANIKSVLELNEEDVLKNVVS